MALFCLNMLEIALVLGEHRSPAYEDMCTKFLEHFAYIATAIYDRGLWDDDDGFYYDVLRIEDERIPLRVRSVVGLLPLCAVTTLSADAAARPSSPPTSTGSSSTAPSSPATSTVATCGPAPRAGCWPSSARSGWPASSTGCSTRTSCSRRTASARSPPATARSRSCCTSPAWP